MYLKPVQLSVCVRYIFTVVEPYSSCFALIVVLGPRLFALASFFSCFSKSPKSDGPGLPLDSVHFSSSGISENVPIQYSQIQFKPKMNNGNLRRDRDDFCKTNCNQPVEIVDLDVFC